MTRYDAALAPLDLDLDLEQLEQAVAPTFGERLGRGYSRLLGIVRRRRIDLAILGALLVVAGAVHMRGMYTSPARFDDEGTYTAYAWAVQYTHRLGHYTYWYAHPPLGWIQMAAWNWLTGAFDRAPYAVAAGRQFMVVCKLLSVALIYGLGLRLRFTRVGAVGAALLFSLSPLAVYFTRTALLDNIVTPWLLASFYLAASRRRGLGGAASAATCFAMAVLTKETALLFLPALVVLFWQASDRRNRRFSATVFGATLCLLLGLYPAYAVIKGELFAGPGHVSLQYAITWQLFDRQGSGSVFDPRSTAHTVVHTWLVLDPWLPLLALGVLLPGLLLRRTRAVAFAFAIQVSSLLRNGYLPYPFVVAMIPFAALTVAGVLDALWQAGRTTLPDPLGKRPVVRWLTADRPAQRSVVAVRPSALVTRVRRVLGERRAARRDRTPGRLRTGALWSARAAVVGLIATFAVVVHTHWTASLGDLWHNDRDAGKAAALAWIEGNIGHDQRIVVDDSLWVDLVRHGYTRDDVIWFTKLDVDKDVKLPSGWRSIQYVLLDYQDTLSVHLTLDRKASPSTLAQFPTLGKAIKYSQIVATFGTAGDKVTIWRVRPELAGRHTATSSSTHR